MRIACLFVPMFPLAARLRSEPDLLQEALAVVEGSGGAAHVVAATRRARTKGIHAGLSLAQARGILPKLIARARDAECERTAQEALLEVAETFSPRIEDAGQGVVFIDVSGMGRHFAERSTEPVAPMNEEFRISNEEFRNAGGGTASPILNSSFEIRNSSFLAADGDSDCNGRSWLTAAEKRLAQAAIRAADAIGLPARCGIAGSKLAARVAAELPRSPTVVEAGKETEFLAPLPLARLAPELEAASTLHRWGIASIGELARLGESEVASRLGEMGRELHRAARGIDPRPLIPRALPPEFHEGMDLEWPLVALDPFLFIASAALDRLARRMELQGFACRRIELSMKLEPDGWHARAIDLPAPTRDVKTMLTLLRLDLEKTPPGAPVTGFTLTAHPDRPRRAQLSLFGPAALAPEKLATAIARLVAMLGEGRVGMHMTVEGHLPERFAVGAFAPPPPPDARREPRRSHGLVATRVFRPPGAGGGRPRPARDDEPGQMRIESIRGEGDLTGEVRVCTGPWQVEEGWWSSAPADRSYWDVELHSGAAYRLYREGEGWFVDARYE